MPYGIISGLFIWLQTMYLITTQQQPVVELFQNVVGTW